MNVTTINITSHRKAVLNLKQLKNRVMKMSSGVAERLLARGRFEKRLRIVGGLEQNFEEG